MIYLIISNVLTILAGIIAYVKFLQFKTASDSEINNLRAKIDLEIADKLSAKEQFSVTSKAGKQHLEALLQKIDEFKKERENEIKLRFEAEKQVELALQKTDDVQKRLQDWKVIQDAVMKDAQVAIEKMGGELYQKLSDNYKVEIETNKTILSSATKNISEFVEKYSAEQQQKSRAEMVEKKSINQSTINDLIKKSVLDLVEMLKIGGKLLGQDYFLPLAFDEKKSKSFLCDFAFIDAGKLYIIDFKGYRYFAEYKISLTQDKNLAVQNLIHHLDKYFAYLSNTKYRDSILKVIFSTPAKFTKNSVVIVLRSKSEIQIIKEIQYYEKARKLGLEITDLGEINNLILQS